ncbi:hypothetical protein [Sphingomonas sp. 28-63-12]|uniref:hypothetical protein n=1 Tax=Sphingomonas sp. 28-63-12 TaxID=1970434 RepID=UPI000BD98832|nr:MAG: hypothetical protein B7Y47_06450 [Sphingomonas sp. 28-63-12]
MENDDTEKLLNEIGQLLAEDIEFPINNTLLYAELDYGMVSPSIFKDIGNQILYRIPDLDAFSEVLLDLWDEQPEGRRWAEMEYLVRDGKFDAVFVYPDEIDPDEDPMDRRTRIVRRYFGDKPIVYPQPGEE